MQASVKSQNREPMCLGKRGNLKTGITFMKSDTRGGKSLKRYQRRNV